MNDDGISILDVLGAAGAMSVIGFMGVALYNRGVEGKTIVAATEQMQEAVEDKIRIEKKTKFNDATRIDGKKSVSNKIEIQSTDHGYISHTDFVDKYNKAKKPISYANQNLADTSDFVEKYIISPHRERLGKHGINVSFENGRLIFTHRTTEGTVRRLGAYNIPLSTDLTLVRLNERVPLHMVGKTALSYPAIAGKTTIGSIEGMEQRINDLIHEIKSNISGGLSKEAIAKEVASKLLSDDSFGMKTVIGEIRTLTSNSSAYTKRVAASPYIAIGDKLEEVINIIEQTGINGKDVSHGQLRRLIRSLTFGWRKESGFDKEDKTLGIPVGSKATETSLTPNRISMYESAGYEQIGTVRSPLVREVLSKINVAFGNDRSLASFVSSYVLEQIAVSSGNTGFILSRGKNIASRGAFATNIYLDSMFSTGGKSDITSELSRLYDARKDIFHQIYKTLPFEQLEDPRFGRVSYSPFNPSGFGFNKVSMPAIIVDEKSGAVYSNIMKTPGLYSTEGSVGILRGSNISSFRAITDKTKTVYGGAVRDLAIDKNFEVYKIENGKIGSKVKSTEFLSKDATLSDAFADEKLGKEYVLRSRLSQEIVSPETIIIDNGIGEKRPQIGTKASASVSRGEFIFGAAIEKVNNKQGISIRTGNIRTLHGHQARTSLKTGTTYMIDDPAISTPLNEKLFGRGGEVYVGRAPGPAIETAAGYYAKWEQGFRYVMGEGLDEVTSQAVAKVIVDAMESGTDVQNTIVDRIAGITGVQRKRHSLDFTYKINDVLDSQIGKAITGSTGGTEFIVALDDAVSLLDKDKAKGQEFYAALTRRYKPNMTNTDKGKLIKQLKDKYREYGVEAQRVYIEKAVERTIKQSAYTKAKDIKKQRYNLFKYASEFVVRDLDLEYSGFSNIAEFKKHANVLLKLDTSKVNSLSDLQALAGNNQEALDAIEFMKSKEQSGKIAGLLQSGHKNAIAKAFLTMDLINQSYGGELTSLRLFGQGKKVIDYLLDPHVLNTQVGIRNDPTLGARVKLSKSFNAADRIIFSLTGDIPGQDLVSAIMDSQRVLQKQKIAAAYTTSMLGGKIPDEILEAHLPNTKDITRAQFKELSKLYNRGKGNPNEFITKWYELFGEEAFFADLGEGYEFGISAKNARIEKTVTGKRVKQILMPALQDLGVTGVLIEGKLQASKSLDLTMKFLEVLFNTGGDLSKLTSEERKEFELISENLLQSRLEEMSKKRTAITNPAAISKKNGITARTFSPVQIQGRSGTVGDMFTIEISSKDAEQIVKDIDKGKYLNETVNQKLHDITKEQNLTGNDIIKEGKKIRNEVLTEIMNEEAHVRLVGYPNLHSGSTNAVKVKIGDKVRSGEINVSTPLMVLMSRDTDMDTVALFVKSTNANEANNLISFNKTKRNKQVRIMSAAAGVDESQLQRILGLSADDLERNWDFSDDIMSYIEKAKKSKAVISPVKSELSMASWQKIISAANGNTIELSQIEKFVENLSDKARLSTQTGIVTNLLNDILFGVHAKSKGGKVISEGVGSLIVDFSGGLKQITIEKVMQGAVDLSEKASSFLGDYFDISKTEQEVATSLDSLLDALLGDNAKSKDLGKLFGLLSENDIRISSILYEHIREEGQNFSDAEKYEKVRSTLRENILEARGSATAIRRARSNGLLSDALLRNIAEALDSYDTGGKQEEARMAVLNLIERLTGSKNVEGPLLEEIKKYEEIAGIFGLTGMDTEADVVEVSNAIRKQSVKTDAIVNPAERLSKAKTKSLLFNAEGKMTGLGKFGVAALALLGGGALINIATSGSRSYTPSSTYSPLPPPPPNIGLSGRGGIISTPDHMSPTYNGSSNSNYSYYGGRPASYAAIPDSDINVYVENDDSNWIQDYRQARGIV